MPARLFDYESKEIKPGAVYPEGGFRHRPIVLATLRAASGNEVRVQAILDSGAEVCVFPLSLAMALGSDIERMPSSLSVGLGGGVGYLTWYETITIDLGPGLEFSARVGFTSAEIPRGLGLLGQTGFFDCHNVEFRLKEGFFTIERADSRIGV